MLHRFTFLLLATLCTVFLTAQTTFQPRSMDSGRKGFVFNTETAFNFKMHTNGWWAVGMDFGKLRTYNKTRFWGLEIGELRHPKETTLNFEYPSVGNGRVSRPFRFGKQNSLYVVRLAFGQKRYLSEKARQKGVAVGYSYAFGPTLGLLKPYYLELFPVDAGGAPPRSVRYSERTAERFLQPQNIYGSSGFGKGLGEVMPRPGGSFRVAAHFDWGAFDEYIKAVEVGIMGDIFLTQMPIMVDIEGTENRPYFLNFFVAAQLGKRKL